MKQTILLAAIVLLSISGHSQMIKDSLIADETTCVDLKRLFKVVTFNKQIYDTLVNVKGNIVMDVTITFCNPKKYSIYFRPAFKEEVLDFFLLLNQKK